MTLHVKSATSLKGKVALPASKSYSIRAFIIASSGGRSIIKNTSNCDDAIVSIKVASLLGSKVIKQKNNVWKVDASRVKNISCKIDVGESGTVLRFLLPIASLSSQKISIVGKGTLCGRPNLHLTNVLRKMGINIKGAGKKDSVPISLNGGELKGGKISIDGTLSSQFISALLIVAPKLKENTNIFLTGKKLVSSDYIAMTLQVLKLSGIKITKRNSRNYYVQGNQKFNGLKNFVVPSDYGLAAFLMAAATLIKSDIILEGRFNDKLIQADGHILRILKKMGVKFTKTSQSIKIKGPFKLKGGEFSLKDCPDLVPIVSVLALFASGKTRLYDIGHVRAKESDRISDLRKELLKVGAKVSEKKNELVIYPQKEYKEDCVFNPHNDHRLAMSFAVLGLKLGSRVENIECSSKSYPGFVRDFKAIGAKTKSK
ncbi:MAG: 3-phosphoshikimate 1-carboxyvinyltransferase [Candidatus Zapsychrus exili]|nr:3-phosphoshikimate 1-carboxyvinyltransferase [Candidatus Zapsychrus exili]